MPVLDMDIVSQLPYLTWCGLNAPPYDNVKVSLKNALAPRKIPYVAGTVHDDLARHEFELSAKLWFCNGLKPIPPTGDRYFPDYFNRYLPNLVQGSVNTLGHPILGPVRARVEHVEIDLSGKVRSGAIVDVKWVDTIEDPSDNDLVGYANVTLPTAAQAAAVDAACAPFGVVYATGGTLVSTATQFGIVLVAGQETLGASDIFAAILGLLSATVFTLSLLSLISAFQAGIASMYDQIFALNDPLTYAALDELVGFWVALDNKKQQIVSSARKTATYVTPSRTTIDSVARLLATQLGVDPTKMLASVIGLNLKLLFRPGIPAGTPVLYYAT